MSFSLPVDRPGGRTLVVGSAECRAYAVAILQPLGYTCAQSDDPYTAMAELCRRASAYRSLVISLVGLYREELAFISTVRRRFAQIEIWLSQTDGRAAALAEASRLGATGLLGDDGLHRFAIVDSPPQAISVPPPQSSPVIAASKPSAPRMAVDEIDESPSSSTEAQTAMPAERDGTMLDMPGGEAVLTADELRALLQDHPVRNTTDVSEA